VLNYAKNKKKLTFLIIKIIKKIIINNKNKNKNNNKTFI